MSNSSSTLQETGQYNAGGLARYEWIFGTDFLSSGAQQAVECAARALELHGGSRVLDVGSGYGGAAFYFASQCGAHVTGLDVLPQMVAEAQRRAGERNAANVSFVLGDVLTAQLPAAAFDAVYSKDSFLHVHDKPRLFTVLLSRLAPGGRVFFCDYLRGIDKGSAEFEAYAAESGYDLLTPDRYCAAIAGAGFADVVFEDWSDRLIDILVDDISTLRSASASANAPSASDLDYLIDRWGLKLRSLRADDMKWGSFSARRPK